MDEGQTGRCSMRLLSGLEPVETEALLPDHPTRVLANPIPAVMAKAKVIAQIAHPAAAVARWRSVTAARD
jgi:hypothetical protein